jgi:hypothetical protein
MKNARRDAFLGQLAINGGTQAASGTAGRRPQAVRRHPPPF